MNEQLAVITEQPTLASAQKAFDLLDVSEATRTDYKYRIGLFLEYTSTRGFNRNSYLEYKQYLRDRNDLAVSTKNKYLATAKIFLKEANRQGLLTADITQNVKTFSQSKKHKRDGLNDSEVTLLAKSLRELAETPQNTRLKAIVSLLALQGLRQIEVSRLDVKDLDLLRKTALIQGKGNDDKEPISLHPEACRALQSYLKSNKIADGALFTSQSNNSRNQRLTTRAIRSLVKEMLNGLGIDKTTHGFRHYFTTKLIKTYKGDLLEVAGYTRHKSLEMLQVYNDSVRKEADLPRFYGAFSGLVLA